MNGDIREMMQHVRAITEKLEEGEVSLEQPKQFRDEGKGLLADVEEDLDIDYG